MLEQAAVCLCRDQPRSLFSGECGHRDGGAEPSLSRRIAACEGTYSVFLEKKEEFLHAQSKRQEALENLVHSEIEWLRRGAKARTTQIESAHRESGRIDGRTRRPEHAHSYATAQIDFSATDRKTKRLIELQNVAYEIGGRTAV